MGRGVRGKKGEPTKKNRDREEGEMEVSRERKRWMNVVGITGWETDMK